MSRNAIRRISASDRSGYQRLPIRTLPSLHRVVQGGPVNQPDVMSTGIAQADGATLATRNVRDFEDCGIPLIDPWH